MAKPETLETMLASSPALSSDPVAVGKRVYDVRIHVHGFRYVIEFKPAG